MSTANKSKSARPLDAVKAAIAACEQVTSERLTDIDVDQFGDIVAETISRINDKTHRFESSQNRTITFLVVSAILSERRKAIEGLQLVRGLPTR